MRETRKQVKARLQNDGKWEEFLNLRNQLTKDGLTSSQARAEAIRQIDSAHHLEEPTVNETRENSTSINGGGPPPLENGLDFSRQLPNADAVQWVAENIANSQVPPANAPNGVSWGLLQWVRRTPANETNFWGTIWPKLFPTGAAAKQRQEPVESKPRDPQEPCPTCGNVIPKDIGTQRALKALDRFLKENEC